MDQKDEFYEKYNEVIDLYNKYKTINKVVELTNLSQVKVRKILITADLWSSKTSIEVAMYLKEGKSADEIADILNVTVDSVHAYSPYQRSIYMKSEKTSDADRSMIYRKRKTTAFKAQKKKIPSIKRNNVVLKKERKNTMISQKQKPGDIERKMLHLHLELIDEWSDSKQKEIIKKYGKTQSGKFTRDIIIPSDMTLHALSYAILRSFGWQNSHLHSFSLTEEDFNFATKGMFKNWTDLCGAIFRFPTDDLEDIYWDDDYDESESFKSWIRKKYTGPYEYLGMCERFEFARREVTEFYKRFKTVKVSPPFRWKKEKESIDIDEKERIASPMELSLDEMNRAILFEEGYNTLMENIEVSNILAEEQQKDLLNSKWIDHINKLVESVENGEHHLNNAHVIQGIKPFVNTLIYRYDYGDNWEVRIKCKNIIAESSLESRKKEGMQMIPQHENQVTWTDVEETVLGKHRPICIARDGMNLVDDVGGLGGFCDFLNTLYGDGEDEEGVDLRSWAKWQGWSARVPSPKTTL